MQTRENSAKKPPKMNIGSSSLVVIFSVLCLTVFSVLSLSSSLVEKKLAETGAEAVRKYYEADFKASSLAEDVYMSYALTGEAASFAEEAGFKALDTPEGEYVSYSVTIDERQALSVVLKFSDSKMTVEEWQTIQTGEWTPDDSIDVWDGGNF